MYKYYIPFIIGGNSIVELSLGSITVTTNSEICSENIDKSMQLIREKIAESEKPRRECNPDQILILNFILVPSLSDNVLEEEGDNPEEVAK